MPTSAAAPTPRLRHLEVRKAASSCHFEARSTKGIAVMVIAGGRANITFALSRRGIGFIDSVFCLPEATVPARSFLFFSVSLLLSLPFSGSGTY